MTDTTAITAETTTHMISLYAAPFRDTLSAALLFAAVKETPADALYHICLDHTQGADEITLCALDGHGFYHKRLPLAEVLTDQQDADGVYIPAVQSLPKQSEGAGRLLIPASAASIIVKMLPKRGNGRVTLEIVASETKYTVTFTGPDGMRYEFDAHRLYYPDYNAFFQKALANKDQLSVPQGRAFSIKDFARIAKAIPDTFFNVYFGPEQTSPCLIEYGSDLSIVFMAASHMA
ncbi:hypothetical protein LJC23_07305 [Desulfovibrio sp. OttesenSCG-928-I05]|nr:hypothetical protein [Desulfovibrio sp. OttesenSCG-928-I05]